MEFINLFGDNFKQNLGPTSVMFQKFLKLNDHKISERLHVYFNNNNFYFMALI